MVFRYLIDLRTTAKIPHHHITTNVEARFFPLRMAM